MLGQHSRLSTTQGLFDSEFITLISAKGLHTRSYNSYSEYEHVWSNNNIGNHNVEIAVVSRLLNSEVAVPRLSTELSTLSTI